MKRTKKALTADEKIKKAVKLAQTSANAQSVLHDAVSDQFSLMATNINNSGPLRQIMWLKIQGVNIEELADKIIDD